MGILASDTFNRAAGNPGGSWAGSTGSFRIAASGTVLENNGTSSGVMRYGTTSMPVVHLQAFIKLGTTNTSARAGLVFWYNPTDATYYYAALGYSGGLRVYLARVSGSTTTLTSVLLPFSTYASFHRLSVDTSGSHVRVYVDDLYHEANHGPVLDYDTGVTEAPGDLFGVNVVSPPSAGISQWDGFVAGDGEPMTLYVRYAAATHEEDGTSSRPERNVPFALNSVLCVRHGTVKDIGSANWGPTTASPGAGYAAHIMLGHVDKFGDLVQAPFSFPEYSVDTGECIEAGHPNLTFEAKNGGTTTWQSSMLPVGTDTPCLTIDGTSYATGILFRGFQFDEEEDSYYGDAVQVPPGPTHHALSFDKCWFRSRYHPTTNALVTVTGSASLRFRYCTSTNSGLDPATPAAGTALIRVNSGGRATWDFKFCAFLADVRYLVSMDSTATFGAASDRYDLDHVTFARFATTALSGSQAGLLYLARPDLFRGLLEVQNSILGQVNNTAYTTNVNYGLVTGNGTAPPAGSRLSTHHNGFYNLNSSLSNRYNYPAVWLTDSQHQDVVSSPGFSSLSQPYSWPHTAGSGAAGEGTFSGHTIFGYVGVTVVGWDIRGLTAAYQNSADDRSPQSPSVVLDLGGIQQVRVPTPVQPADTYCPSMLYDTAAGGLQTSLSGRLISSRPIAMERDAELRSSRAQDVHVELADWDGHLNPSITASLLQDPATFEPNWKNKACLLGATRGSTVLTSQTAYLEDVENEPGKATFRLSDRYEFLAGRTICANQQGKVWSTGTNTKGYDNQGLYPFYKPRDASAAAVSEHPGVCAWGCKTNEWARPGSWTFEITSTDGRFICTGSETGYEGTGIVGRAFSPKSRSFALSAYDETDPDLQYTTWLGLGAYQWEGDPLEWGGTFTVGNTFGFDLVLRVPSTLATGGLGGTAVGRAKLFSPIDTTVGAALIGLLTSSYGAAARTWAPHPAAVTAQDLDSSITPGVVLSGLGTTMAGYFVWNQPVKVLDAIQEVAHHCGGTVIPATGGKLAFVSYLPRVLPSDPDVLCENDDLMELVASHQVQYDRIVAQYEFDAARGTLIREARFEGYDVPAPVSAGNIESPTLSLRAFTLHNEAEVNTLLQALYQRYKRRRRHYRIKAKIARMGAELTDVYGIQATGLVTTPDFCEVIAVRKEWVGDLSVEMEAVDLSAWKEGTTIHEPAFIRLTSSTDTSRLRGYATVDVAATNTANWFVV